MKFKIIPIIIVLGLLAVTSLSFLGTSNLHETGSHDCLASFLLKTDCPLSEESITLAIHHISEIQNLTRSILSFNVSLTILSALFVSVLLVISKVLPKIVSLQIFFYKTYHKNIEIIFTAKRNFLRWLVFQYRQGVDVFRIYDMA